MESVTPTKQASGWQASLKLVFQSTPTQTILSTRQHSGPLMVQRPFYPEGKTCHVYILHPPGGIVGGDQLKTHITLEENSQALITMPGATKFYRSLGATSNLTQHFELKENSCLEWLPQDNILFPGAKANINTRFNIRASSRLIAWDVTCLGRPVLNETFTAGQCHSKLEVWKDNEPMLIERFCIENGNLDIINHHAYVASMILYPGTPALLERLRLILEDQIQYCGATLLNDLLVIRFLANDNLVIQKLMQKLWHEAREHITSQIPAIPRIWLT